MLLRCMLLPLLGLFTLVACEKGVDDATTTERVSPGAVAAGASDPAEVRRMIDSVNAVIITALKAEDNAKMVSLMAPDAVVMLDNHPAWKGTGAIDENGRVFLESVDIQDMVLTTEHVEVSGDLAVESGSMVMTFQPKGAPVMTDSGKFVTVWKRQGDGSWKIFRDISNSNIPMR